MDYILSRIDQKISFLKKSNKNEELKVHVQSKLEYLLLLTLSYLWNKNWLKLEVSDKEFCVDNILRPSIGSIVACARKLDIEKEIFGNKNERDLYQALDDYPSLRNERIGHGYTFEDSTSELLKLFENLLECIQGSSMFLYQKQNDIILVLDNKKGVASGIIFKSDGFTYTVWSCPESIHPFDINATYIFTEDNQYYKISPFIEIEEEGDAYIFAMVQEKLTGRIKYNKLLKTGICLKDRKEIASLLITNEKHKRKTANGTIINNFEKNYKKFIHTETKKKIKKFLLKNKSSVFATIWGHGGVGKTASIQSVCEDLSNEQNKSFDYIIFVTAKNRIYNYYRGSIQELENNLASYTDVIKYINSIIFEEEKFNPLSISNFEGKLLLIIDDFETFSKQENHNIIEFIKSLNINHHKVILTTRSATFITGEEIQTNELTPDETKDFLLEAAKIELPDYNIDLLKKELEQNGNLEKVHEVTSGRPLFIFQFAILLGQKGSLEETLKYDIKATKEAINFLYDRIYDYLSVDAKNMFISISLLTKEDDLSNLLEKLKFILNKEKKEEEFQIALNELIKLKIIEIIDKDFFKVYSPEIYRLMKKYYEKKGAEYEGNITNRYQLITSDKSLDTEWSLLENADASRIISSEAEVENKYRYILNREKSPKDIKLKAALNFSSYLVAHKGKTDKAIKLFDDYYHIFYKEVQYIKYYSQYCWAEGNDLNKIKAIEIIQNFLATKPKLQLHEYLDIIGILMVYISINLINEREDIKEKKRYREIDKKTYDALYEAQRERFQEVYTYPGNRLYKMIKETDLNNIEAYARHSALEGLAHFVEISIRNRKLKVAKEVCHYVIDNLPQNFQRPFIFKLSKIDSLERPNRVVDPFKKAETEFGEKLKATLLKSESSSVSDTKSKK